MCDYSLEAYRSRPARESEKYVTTRFDSGSIGLASPGDRTTAVCVPRDARLRLQRIPSSVQAEFGVGPDEDVTFVHLEFRGYQDGVEFGNGARVSLQLLGAGVTATVTRSLEAMVRESTAVPAL